MRPDDGNTNFHSVYILTTFRLMRPGSCEFTFLVPGELRGGVQKGVPLQWHHQWRSCGINPMVLQSSSSAVWAFAPGSLRDADICRRSHLIKALQYDHDIALFTPPSYSRHIHTSLPKHPTPHTTINSSNQLTINQASSTPPN